MIWGWVGTAVGVTHKFVGPVWWQDAFTGCEYYFLHGFRMACLVRIGMGARFCLFVRIGLRAMIYSMIVISK